MQKWLWALALGFLTASGSRAGEVWNTTFPGDAATVVDIYNGNPSKVEVGAPVGNQLPLTVQDSTSFAQTDRAGRALGFNLDGHAEYSGYMNFGIGAQIPAGGQTWTTLGFSSGPPGVPGNPGVAREVSCAFLIWNHNGAGNVTLNFGLQWASSSGQDRNKIVSVGDIGTDADVLNKTFQLAIGYQGDVDGNTNTVDPSTGHMTVSLYGNGTLLKTVSQGNITAGDGGGQTPLITGLGGEPGSYPTFLSNQQLSYLGGMDYVATASGRNVVYMMNSMAWYDAFGDAFAAVVTPEPTSLLMLAAGGLVLGRRARTRMA